MRGVLCCVTRQKQLRWPDQHNSFGVFHLSELAGWTSQLANEIDFFQKVLLKNHLLHAYFLGFDWSGWIALIKSKNSHYDGNGLAGQFWQMESAPSVLQ